MPGATLPFFAALLLLSVPLHAAEVNVYLTSGEVVRGQIVSQDDEQIHLRRSMMLSSGVVIGVMVYDRSQIDKMVDAPDPLIEFRQKEIQTPDTATDHAALARWCRGMGLIEQAQNQALRAVLLEPNNAAGIAEEHALGFIFAEGTWQLEKPYLLRTGQVRYAGSIMTKAAAESLQAQARVRQDQDVDKNRLAMLGHQMLSMKAEDNTLATRCSAIALEQKTLLKRIAEDQAVITHFQDLNDALTRAQSQPAAQGGGAPGRKGAGAGWGGETGTNTGGPDGSDLVRLGDAVEAARPLAKTAGDDIHDAQIRQARLERENQQLSLKRETFAKQMLHMQEDITALEPPLGDKQEPAAPGSEQSPAHKTLPPALSAPDAPAPQSP